MPYFNDDSGVLNDLRWVQTRLRRMTEGCRLDMHEPDEQGLAARVVGDHLDNAFGSHVNLEQMLMGAQEFVLVLERPIEGKTVRENFNLATLIALARAAKLD